MIENKIEWLAIREDFIIMYDMDLEHIFNRTN